MIKFLFFDKKKKIRGRFKGKKLEGYYWDQKNARNPPQTFIPLADYRALLGNGHESRRAAVENAQVFHVTLFSYKLQWPVGWKTNGFPTPKVIL